MALTAATRVAVITRRGRSRMGLAQSRDEAERWMEDAIRYRAAGATGRAIVAINAPPGPGARRSGYAGERRTSACATGSRPRRRPATRAARGARP